MSRSSGGRTAAVARLITACIAIQPATSPGAKRSISAMQRASSSHNCTLEPSSNGMNMPPLACCHSKPCARSFNSSITSGCRMPATYAQGDMRMPGHGSAMVQAPPTRSRASSTSTRLPARARYAAHASPLWPAPTMMASHATAASSRMGAGSPSLPRQAAVADVIGHPQVRNAGACTAPCASTCRSLIFPWQPGGLARR